MTRRLLPSQTQTRRQAQLHQSSTSWLEDVDERLRHALEVVLGRLDWRQPRHRHELLPELTLRISRNLRAGRPLEQALADAAESNHPGICRASEQLEVGRPLNEALDGWAATTTSEAEHLLVAALIVGVESGGQLARTLDLVGEGIRDDLQLATRRQTLLTQSRLSAGVLVALPIVFAAVASMLQGRIVYQGVAGLVLLIVGIGLDLVGLVWIRQLLRSLR